MDITQSKLFIETFAKAEELRNTFLVPACNVHPGYAGLRDVRHARFFIPDPRKFDKVLPEGPQLPGEHEGARRAAASEYRDALNEAAFDLAKHFRLRLRPAAIVRLAIDADHTLVEGQSDNERWLTSETHEVKDETLRERCEKRLFLVLSPHFIFMRRRPPGFIDITIPAEMKVPKAFHVRINEFRDSGEVSDSFEVPWRSGYTNDRYHLECTLWGRSRVAVADLVAEEALEKSEDPEAAVDKGLDRYRARWQAEAGGPALTLLRRATSLDL